MLDFSKLPNPNPLTGGLSSPDEPTLAPPPAMEPRARAAAPQGERLLVDSASGITSAVFSGSDDRRSRMLVKRFNERYTEYLTQTGGTIERVESLRDTVTEGLPLILDAGLAGAQLVVYMRGAEGESLEQMAMRHPGIDPQDAKAAASALANGVAALHARGLMHLDVRPATIVWDAEARTAALLDPGHCVPIIGIGEGPPGFPGPGFGGMPYTSMELLAGAPPHPSDDVFALACVVYEMIGGTHPYGRRSAADAATFGLNPAPLPMLDSKANDVLLRALALQRDRRTVSVSDLAAAIRGRVARPTRAERARERDVDRDIEREPVRAAPPMPAPREVVHREPRSGFLVGALSGGLVGAVVAGAIVASILIWRPGGLGEDLVAQRIPANASAATQQAPTAVTPPAATPATPQSTPGPVATAPPVAQAPQTSAPQAPAAQSPVTPAPLTQAPIAPPATPPALAPEPNASATPPAQAATPTLPPRPVPDATARRTSRAERDRSDRATADKVPSEAYYEAVRTCPACNCTDLRLKRFAYSKPLTWEEASFLINVCERGS